MYIQWFPGHMYKAKQAIQNRLKTIDLVIEVLDARLPRSSMSPLLEKLSQHKAKLKLLNKADLADPLVTKAWLNDFSLQLQCLAITAHHPHQNKVIIQKCRAMLPHRRGMDKPLRIMICGAPNVGKSSLINNLLGHKITKTGNEAGVTKQEQRLVLADDIWLYDTPGMLWEKIIVPESGYRLAIAGSIGKNAYDGQQVVLHILGYLKQYYWSAVLDRYRLNDMKIDHNISSDHLLTLLAQKRGAIQSGGYIDYQKISELVMQDFRLGYIGKISLETPSQWLQWKELAEQYQKESRKIKK